jgi:hypothetical protein
VIEHCLPINQDGSPCLVVTTITPRASKNDSSMSNIATSKFLGFTMLNREDSGSVCRFTILSYVLSEMKSNYFLQKAVDIVRATDPVPF